MSDYRDNSVTGWVGWVYFAGVMMIMLGSFHAIEGLIALFDDEYYLVTDSGLVVSVDYTTWGWVHLILGLLVVGAGVAVVRGQTWGRALGVLLAVISALVNLAFIAAYPIWSTIMITVGIIVIYALIVHGAEVRSDHY